MSERRTIVIGGGLAGFATLYELARRGERAVLLEAAEDLATGASYANGGMLTPSTSSSTATWTSSSLCTGPW